MSKYATGKHSKAISDRSGLSFHIEKWLENGMVHLYIIQSLNLNNHNLNQNHVGGDGVALLQVRPDRTEPATTVRIVDNGFETYAAGSGIINVFSPGHGLTDSTTYRFRGPPTTSAGSSFCLC